MYTRREIGKLGLALLAPRASATTVERINGVWIGIKGFSFRDRSLDDGIAATKQLGLNSWELSFNNVEPAALVKGQLRNWRLTVPLEEFRKVRRKFDENGIVLIGYSFPTHRRTEPGGNDGIVRLLLLPRWSNGSDSAVGIRLRMRRGPCVTHVGRT